MDDPTYQAWWELHARVARGESLNPEEEEAYQDGLAQMHRADALTVDVSALQRSRRHLRDLEREQLELRARSEQLDAQIAVLEAALGERARRLLGVGAK